MNNYCRNCGKKLTRTDICEKCNTKVLNTRMGELNTELAKKYIHIFLIMIGIEVFCFYFLKISDSIINVPEIILSLFLILMSLLPIATFIFVIVAKVNLKYSKFFNIIFWIMLSLLILLAALIILTLLSCEYQF